jgi:hypothetical protein
MHFRRWVIWVVAVGAFAAACKGGSGAKSSESGDGNMVYDEEGKGFECDTPDSACEEVKDPSLDFKEQCRSAGYKMRRCGCANACSGNINGTRSGFDRKNVEKNCQKADEKCEMPETSAAFDDACTEAGHQMIECGCEWRCSGKLKETLPDPPKEEEPKAEDDAKDGAKKPAEKEPEAGASMDGPVKEPQGGKKK